jgi:Tfp pilus assembly protein PilF
MDAQKTFSQALTLFNQSRHDEALNLLKDLLQYDPIHFDGNYLMGFILGSCGDSKVALGYLERAIELRPNHLEALINLGNAHLAEKNYGKALECFSRAIELQNNYGPAYFGKALALAGDHDFSAALIAMKHAVTLRPDWLVAWRELSSLYFHCANPSLASEAISKAIALQADPELIFRHALILLADQQWEFGWSLYEYRWKTVQKESIPRLATPPLLSLNQVQNRTVLIVSEMGLGDILQFARYIPFLINYGARVVLQCPETLKSLLSSVSSNLVIIDPNQAVPDHDYWCPIMSLPKICFDQLRSPPNSIPYLRVSTRRNNLWEKRVAKSHRLQVGLVMSGKIRPELDQNVVTRRSIEIANWTPLLDTPYDFHLLQKDISSGERVICESYSNCNVYDHFIEDFEDTAALLLQMDLLISIDTSVAHVAGALGQTTWLILPYLTDYRWLLSGDRTPWYPTIKIFRQSRPGDWSSIVSSLPQKLRQFDLSRKI